MVKVVQFLVPYNDTWIPESSSSVKIRLAWGRQQIFEATLFIGRIDSDLRTLLLWLLPTSAHLPDPASGR